MYLKLRYLIFIILFTNIFCSTVLAYNETNIEPIKIGIYEDTPYITINYNNEITGYYAEFLELIKKEGKVDYKLVISDFPDLLRKLESGDIDILMGLASTKDRQEKFIFNKHKIAIETHTINSSKNIRYGDLSKIEGKTIGLIEDGANSDCVLKFLQGKNINNIIPIYAQNFDALEDMLNQGSIDLMLGSAARATKYKSIYTFESHPVYIGAHRNNQYILNYIDNQIEKISLRENNLIISLYDKYFHPKHKFQEIINGILIALLLIIFIIFYFGFIRSKIKKYKIKNKIRQQLNSNKYLIYYQPILNPHTNKIIGFEGLLRLIGNNKKILSPYYFLHEIENNDMLFEVSLWILKTIVTSYPLISNTVNFDYNFYISMNLSLNEIANEDFVNSAIQILSNSNIGHNKICLEIVENVKIDKLEKLNTSIKRLKDAGFKIAIDDFGIEYSNLDVLKKLDFDIVKLDKYFVDDLSSCEIKQEVIRFISKVATVTNKSLIIEGVEEYYQLDLLKLVQNSRLYIQGYIYSKPVPLEELVWTVNGLT